MSLHAILSPSSAARWTRCPGSVALTRGMPDEGSKYADDGTATHELAALCLQSGSDASAFLGRIFPVNGSDYEVDDARAERAQFYVDYVRSLGGEVFVEQRLSIQGITGEEGAHGTSDAVVVTQDELIIVDLKDGMGEVVAENNEQLIIYAMAALRHFEFLEFDHVRMVIVQPRQNAIREWDIPVADLVERAGVISEAAMLSWCYLGGDPLPVNPRHLSPGDKQCKYCKAKATCPALAEKVQQTIGNTFEDMVEMTNEHGPKAVTCHEDISQALAAVDLIEDWCEAVRAEGHRRLCNGIPVPGFKLVAGKKGARAWTNAAEAETTLKSMRLKVEQMYDLKLISPTTAEKLAKAGDLGPRQWDKLQALITQADGKPSVAPESDKRQAIQVGPRAEVFNDLAEA